MDQSRKIKDATGKNVYPINFADYGIHLVSSGIIANKETVKGHTDMVRRFLAASTTAIEEASKHPGEAADAILKENPKGGKKEKIGRASCRERGGQYG